MPVAHLEFINYFKLLQFICRLTISTHNGEIELSVPRDRNCEFEPIIVPKHSRRLEGIDKNIMALYARGMSVRDIRDILLYQLHYSFRRCCIPPHLLLINVVVAA